MSVGLYYAVGWQVPPLNKGSQLPKSSGWFTSDRENMLKEVQEFLQLDKVPHKQGFEEGDPIYQLWLYLRFCHRWINIIKLPTNQIFIEKIAALLCAIRNKSQPGDVNQNGIDLANYIVKLVEHKNGFDWNKDKFPNTIQCLVDQLAKCLNVQSKSMLNNLAEQPGLLSKFLQTLNLRDAKDLEIVRDFLEFFKKEYTVLVGLYVNHFSNDQLTSEHLQFIRTIYPIVQHNIDNFKRQMILLFNTYIANKFIMELICSNSHQFNIKNLSEILTEIDEYNQSQDNVRLAYQLYFAGADVKSTTAASAAAQSRKDRLMNHCKIILNDNIQQVEAQLKAAIDGNKVAFLDDININTGQIATLLLICKDLEYISCNKGILLSKQLTGLPNAVFMYQESNDNFALILKSKVKNTEQDNTQLKMGSEKRVKIGGVQIIYNTKSGEISITSIVTVSKPRYINNPLLLGDMKEQGYTCLTIQHSRTPNRRFYSMPDLGESVEGYTRNNNLDNNDRVQLIKAVTTEFIKLLTTEPFPPISDIKPENTLVQRIDNQYKINFIDNTSGLFTYTTKLCRENALKIARQSRLEYINRNFYVSNAIWGFHIIIWYILYFDKNEEDEFINWIRPFVDSIVQFVPDPKVEFSQELFDAYNASADKELLERSQLAAKISDTINALVSQISRSIVATKAA